MWPALDRPSDVADDVGRTGAVDGRRPQDHGVQRLRLRGARGPRPRCRAWSARTSWRTGRSCGSRRPPLPPGYPYTSVLLKWMKRVTEAAIDASSRFRVPPTLIAGDLVRGRPVGYERAAMEHVPAALGRLRQRAGAGQVADRDLDVELLEPRRVAAGPHQAADLVALAEHPLGQMAADEPGRAGDQADVVALGVDRLAAELRLADHRRLRRGLAPGQRGGGDVAHHAPVLARGAMAVGEHGVERRSGTRRPRTPTASAAAAA